MIYGKRQRDIYRIGLMFERDHHGGTVFCLRSVVKLSSSKPQLDENGDVRRQLATGKFEFSRHAFRRVVERNIKEIREAGTDAEPIEDYPEDKYSPSALLLGFTAGGRPLHFQVSFGIDEDYHNL